MACADLDRSRAEALAQEHGIPKVLEVEELLASPDVALVVNLTVPSAHADVAWAALKKGKHVYNEKPLALRRREARDLIGLARDKDLRLGCAPDTFLGAALQTCRHLIDEGAIGVPSRDRPSCWAAGRNPGIRIQPFSTKRARVRFSTWGRIISRR